MNLLTLMLIYLQNYVRKVYLLKNISWLDLDLFMIPCTIPSSVLSLLFSQYSKIFTTSALVSYFTNSNLYCIKYIC